jgi:hypothetical protein
MSIPQTSESTLLSISLELGDYLFYGADIISLGPNNAYVSLCPKGQKPNLP